MKGETCKEVVKKAYVEELKQKLIDMQKLGEQKICSEPSPETVTLGETPALLFKVKQDLDKWIAGENKNKLLVFLAGCTAVSARPLGCVITGDSSAGKSHLANYALAHFKEIGIVEDFTRLTEASPDRLGKDFTGLILLIQEIRGIEKAQSTLRVWVSEGGLRLLTTIKDEKGNITTGVVETKGVPVFITTTTNVEPDEEMVNRLFIVSMDETSEQTRKVLDFEAAEYEDIQDSKQLEPDAVICEFLKHGLTPYKVKIPYARLLARAFPSDTIRARRDFKKLMNIVYAVAFIHQHQRPLVQTKTSDGKPGLDMYVVALPADFYMAWTIADKTIKETLLGLQARSLKALSLFDETKLLTSADVAVAADLSQSRAREILNNLVNRGYLVKDESEKVHKYSLRKTRLEDNTIPKILDALKSFDEADLKKWIDGKNLITRSYVYKSFYIDPFTGERIELPIPLGRVIEKTALQTKKEFVSEKQTENNTNFHIESKIACRKAIDFILAGEERE